MRKSFPKAIKPSGTLMHGQFLAQSISHALHGEPARKVLDASLATLFGFFGFDKDSPWWSSRNEIWDKLALLALHARAFAPKRSGAELLHAQRQANLHIVEPPPRTFLVPAEVTQALEQLEKTLKAAIKAKRNLEVILTEEGVTYQLA